LVKNSGTNITFGELLFRWYFKFVANPNIHATLQGVTDTVDGYRGPRNELIHSSAFSSRELGLFQSIRQFRVDTGDIDTDELARRQ